jgi:hypothetical protein
MGYDAFDPRAEAVMPNNMIEIEMTLNVELVSKINHGSAPHNIPDTSDVAEKKIAQRVALDNSGSK